VALRLYLPQSGQKQPFANLFCISRETPSSRISHSNFLKPHSFFLQRPPAGVAHKPPNFKRVKYLPEFDGCFVCGRSNPVGFAVRFRVDGGEVVSDVLLGETRGGYTGIAHGGVLATLMDEAMSWACCVSRKRFCLAAELNVRFLKPTPVGCKLRVHARVSDGNSRVLRTESWISGEDGSIYARAWGRFVPMSLQESLAMLPHLRFGEDTLAPSELLEGAE
jgi:uncharacterized protein (TIGR00369 family)